MGVVGGLGRSECNGTSDLPQSHLGVALGARPGASLARRLMLPVSKDTLLRVVRRCAPIDTRICTESESEPFLTPMRAFCAPIDTL